METLTFIKKDALIPITIGAGFMGKLQHVLTHLLEQRSEEEISTFKALLEAGKPLDDWMVHVETIAVLIKEIEDTAIAQGMSEDKEVTS